MSQAAEQLSGHWMDETLKKQLSPDRDFENPPPVTFQYGILCGHRMGSNLLCEALFESGVAGDPIEYFNLRMLQMLCEERNVPPIMFDDYIAEMKSRRTSPNGVFGFNMKFDQLLAYFADIEQGKQFIKDSDLIIFMHRKDKVRQAISQYIGLVCNTLRVPADADKAQVKELVQNVPFNPLAISMQLFSIIHDEQQWMHFLHQNGIAYETLAYEDLVADYEGTISGVLEKVGVPADKRHVPPQPTMKVSTPKNQELKEQFMDYISGERAIYELLSEDVMNQVILPG